MQSELSKYKEAASDVHSLRADVHSLSSILERKVGIFICVAIFLDAIERLQAPFVPLLFLSSPPQSR